MVAVGALADYDDLGRLTNSQVRSASGDPLQSEQLAYDDVAHTRTWQVQLPPGSSDLAGKSLRAVEQYDGDGHWLSTNIEYLGLDGALISTHDTVVTWDGDRQLMELSTLTPAGSPQVMVHIVKTFKYQCDSAPLATAPRGVGALGALPRALFRRYL